MARRRDEEEDEGIAGMLLGGAKPQLKDLADPRKRKQALNVAKMMGFEIRKGQLVRIGIGIAVVLIVLLIGLWAIAKVLGLLFWAVLALGAVAIVVRLVAPRNRESTKIEPAKPAKPVTPITQASPRDDKALEAWNREAEEQADKALEELERKLKG